MRAEGFITTSTMDTYTATGITLGAHKYGDAARVATFYTRERGKVEATARGIGKPGSKLAAAVEPFTLSQMQFVAGRELDKLTQAEVVEAFLPLRQDMTRFAYGAALLELTDHSTEPHHPVPGLFDALLGALATLVTSGDPELLFWAYALRLLDSQGCAPITAGCVHCGGPTGARVAHQPAEGGFVCADCAPGGDGRLWLSGAAVSVLRTLLTLPYDRLRRLVLPPDTRREVNCVVRAHLACHVTGELRSLRFLDKMARGTE